MLSTLRQLPLTVASAGLLALVLASCQELPKFPGARVQVLEVGALESLNPADVAVPPLLCAEGVQGIPAEMLRLSFQRALIKRRYTPLALEYVDSAVIEAAYEPGRLQEDAVCEVLVHDWDASLWESRTALDADLEMRLLDPRDPTGPPLFAARLPGRFDFGGDARRYATDGARLQAACDELAEELLSAMPARRTGPGSL